MCSGVEDFCGGFGDVGEFGCIVGDYDICSSVVGCESGFEFFFNDFKNFLDVYGCDLFDSLFWKLMVIDCKVVVELDFFCFVVGCDGCMVEVVFEFFCLFFGEVEVEV